MKISVVLPNFNHSAFLADAFEGVLSQGYQDWQLCVVDDASTDDSWAIIERYRERDARIVADRFSRNSGANAAVRRCLELSAGELVYPAAADDYLSDSRFFELAVAALQRFPQAGLAYARAAIIEGDDGRELGSMGSCCGSPSMVKYRSMGVATQFIPPQDALTGFVSHRMFIPGCSVILRRGLMAELGDYDEALGPQSDYFLNHALAALHGAVFIDALVSAGRVSKKSYSGSASDDDYFRLYALVEKRLRALPLPYVKDEGPFAQFRAASINGRTAEAFQRRLFNSIREFCDSIPPDVLWMFPQEPAAFIESLKMDCARLEAALDDNIENARRIFDEVAGPIAPHPQVQQSRPRPWLKPVAEFFLSLGKILGKTFTGVGEWLWQV